MTATAFSRRSLLVGLAATTMSSWAQDGPITIVGPFGAGGTNDVVARIYADKLGKILKRPVIVDNKPGAGGLLAAQHVARARPDASVLLVASNTFLIAPHIFKNAGYNPQHDFKPVTSLYTTGVAWVTRPDFFAQSIKDLVEAARKEPGKITYSTNGIGTNTHLQMEMFQAHHGIRMTHVPFKALPEGTQAVLGGLVDLAVDSPFSVASKVKSGMLRALIVFGAQREEALPEVPTNAQAGYPVPGQLEIFAGIVAPATVADDALTAIRSASDQVMADADFQARLRNARVRPLPMSHAQFDSMMKAYSEKYDALVTRLQLRA